MNEEEERIVVNAVGILLRECQKYDQQAVTLTFNYKDLLDGTEPEDMADLYKDLKLLTDFSFSFDR